MVRQTEPSTKLWFALQENDSTFGIFDVFPDPEGRNQHFAGDVAKALKENAPTLVKGGWDNGVLSEVRNFSVLSAMVTDHVLDAKEATFIKLVAEPGRAQELADLLSGAAKLVEQTEPNTLFWVALQLDENTFGIFDVFTDENGRNEHFAGQVATALQVKSAELVQGGWDNGVVKNVHNFKIIASS